MCDVIANFQTLTTFQQSDIMPDSAQNF